MKRKIKLGIIGTGIAARKLHLPALERLKEEFEIVAVCNHTEPKAKEFSELAGGVPYYLNYKKLLKDKNIEAVDVLLPIELNYKVAKAALKAGKHVIIEKPIAASIPDAKKMLSLDKKYDEVLMIAENFRYRKVYKKAAELIGEGKIGKVYAAQWNVFYHNTTEREYGATKWRQNHVYPGGFIMDGGVHMAAALRDFFGEIKSISAVSDQVNPLLGSHDTIMGLLRFESGVQVNLNMFHTAVSHSENRLLIFGDKGTIEITGYLMQMKNPDASVESIDFGDDSGFYEEFLNFYSAITEDAKVISTTAEAYKDFELILMMLEASEKNKVIKA